MATLHMDTCFVLGTGTTTPSHSYLEVFKIGNLLKIPLCTLVIQSVDHGCFPEQLHRLLTGFPKPVWLLVSSTHLGQQQPLRSTSDNISFLLMSFLRPPGVSCALLDSPVPVFRCPLLLREGFCTGLCLQSSTFSIDLLTPCSAVGSSSLPQQHFWTSWSCHDPRAPHTSAIVLGHVIL